MKFPLAIICGCCMILLVASSCDRINQLRTPPPAPIPDQIFQMTLHDIRLGDGVPVGVDLSVRWNLTGEIDFAGTYVSPERYDSLILSARCKELVAALANTFPSVDSLFSVDRVPFMNALKDQLQNGLAETGIEMKEVMVSTIIFPQTFLSSMEKTGLREQELTAIRQQKVLEIERAKAAKEQAVAQGEVSVAQAEARGRLERIEADIESSRRKRELAQAETQRQVAETQAKSEKKRLELLAEADLTKQKGLKKLEISHLRELDQVAVDKQKALDLAEFESQMQLANLCEENPAYATFLVNRELASHVQIAVLPSNGQDHMLGQFLQQNTMEK
ncbi:SPFH domain-containing protein [Pontibacter sp. G13]|uniref:SPFH domain-containing protein n=1 Tax=Pontibacter sp. G13 TaxID=3074898 RepID=UPI00288A9C53|nr:SPFH domain-containing protein [Pontibacter sp. G13]WNJ17959.1 SPFH domain-containing protein [Pontibacter sp. G13]